MYLGDKTHEQVECPVNDSGNYEIPLSTNICVSPSQIATLEIPKEHSVRCVTRFPTTETMPISHVGMIVSLPNFLPVEHPVTEKIDDNQIRLKISANCAADSINHLNNTNEKFSEYIEKNTTYKNEDGSPQFASIIHLGSNLYLQKNIRVPYHSGNAHIYFHKDKDQKIDFLLYCNDRNECSGSNSNILENLSYSYSFKNINYAQFNELNKNAINFIYQIVQKE